MILAIERDMIEKLKQDLLKINNALENVQKPEGCNTVFLDSKHLDSGLHIYLDSLMPEHFFAFIKSFSPWRKGPFYFHFKDELFFLDSEWKSFTKIEKLLEIFKKFNIDLSNKTCLDVGCNNAYYMLALLSIFKDIKGITGIDPMSNFYMQYKLVEHFLSQQLKDKISFRLIGINDISLLKTSFDIVLCLGVLYHRSDPLAALKSLKRAMTKDSVLILETLIILDEREVSLIPYPTYAGMSNVFFIFSPKALQNLALKAGFSVCELISYSETNNLEQRSTEFSKNSLGDSLNQSHTIEGYESILRGFFYLKT